MQSYRSFPFILSAGLFLSPPGLADTDCSQTTAQANRQSYPTAVIADYVVGCLIANGQTPEIMQKCACSMDYVTAAIPYEEYEKVETLLRVQQMPQAGRTAPYKDTEWSRAAIDHLREVQAESTLRCF